MGDLHAVRIRHGKKVGFVSGTLEKVEVVKSAYDALYWPRAAAEQFADAIEENLGWQTWLVPAPEGAEFQGPNQ